MKAQHTPNLTSLHWDGPEPDAQQGSFEITAEPSGQRRFWFVCPGPCRALAAIALRPVLDGSAQSWEWDGNLAAPTLQPSINHVGCWHGWLRSGEFVSC